MASERRKKGQSAFVFSNGWGGRRAGAGPKPKTANGRPGVSHRARAPLASRFPVHVTMRLRAGLPSLRGTREHAALVDAFAASVSDGFRLVHYSAQGNHVHLLCEARERDELSRGLQGLAIRVAKSLNRLWTRAGKVFADRYHDRILRTPREVRHALAYVLNNWRKHGIDCRREGPDPCSSGRWFAGWRGWAGARAEEGPLSRARTWLLSVGWLRHGRVCLEEVPGGRALVLGSAKD